MYCICGNNRAGGDGNGDGGTPDAIVIVFVVDGSCLGVSVFFFFFFLH